MVTQKKRTRRVNPTRLTNDFISGSDGGFEPLPPAPKEPLPPVNEVYPPKPPKDPKADQRFGAIIDPAIWLGEDAQRRVDKALRMAVLAEIAQLDFGGDIMIRSIGGGGTAGIELIATRSRM